MYTSTISEFINGVKNIKGAPFAKIEYLVEVKVPKKWGLSGVVTKLCSGVVQLNYNYEDAVNRRLAKQGLAPTFKADKLPWGVWDTFNKIISHKGEFYLRYYTEEGRYFDTEWYVNGMRADASQIAIIKAYLASKSKGSAKQSAEGLTEKQVHPQSVNIANISEFECGDFIYLATAKLAV